MITIRCTGMCIFSVEYLILCSYSCGIPSLPTLLRIRDTCRVSFIYYRVSRCRLWVLLRDHDLSFLRRKIQNEFKAILTTQKKSPFSINKTKMYWIKKCSSLRYWVLSLSHRRRNKRSPEWEDSQYLGKMGEAGTRWTEKKRMETFTFMLCLTKNRGEAMFESGPVDQIRTQDGQTLVDRIQWRRRYAAGFHFSRFVHF